MNIRSVNVQDARYVESDYCIVLKTDHGLCATVDVRERGTSGDRKVVDLKASGRKSYGIAAAVVYLTIRYGEIPAVSSVDNNWKPGRF